MTDRGGTAPLSVGTDAERAALTAMHRLFRYPAKFHGPLARGLLETYTKPGSTVLDPFCGSGTLSLEGQLIQRQVDGADIDPVAIFVARAKLAPYDVQQLRARYKTIADILGVHRRSKQQYELLQFQDVSQDRYAIEAAKLPIPNIPNIHHWFRRYVIIDLARIMQTIMSETETTDIDFFRLCFVAIVRLSSNADPVPVSGLEVTHHMLQRDAKGRIIDPYLLFDRAVHRALAAVDQFQASSAYDKLLAGATHFRRLDSTRTLSHLPAYETVITSPPYHGAVDYYRRHTLEMYWINLTATHEQRLAIRPSYLGRLGVAARDCSGEPVKSQYAAELADRMSAAKPAPGKDRSLALRHYCQGMTRFFAQLTAVLPHRGARAVLVVGDSRWKGERIETARLLAELATPNFVLTEVSSHKLKNRYMSYSRHNAASIDTEQVLVFERTR